MQQDQQLHEVVLADHNNDQFGDISKLITTQKIMLMKLWMLNVMSLSMVKTTKTIKTIKAMIQSLGKSLQLQV